MRIIEAHLCPYVGYEKGVELVIDAGLRLWYGFQALWMNSGLEHGLPHTPDILYD